VASVRSRVETARTKAEELQRRSLDRLERESERRGWVRSLVNAYEADRNRGGGLLAGGLAYRIFLWELPASLVVVSVLGLASSAGDKAPEDVARSAGLSGALAETVAAAVKESAQGRWWLLILGTVLMLWAGRGAVLALQVVSEIAWARREPVRPSSFKASILFSALGLAFILTQAVTVIAFRGVVLQVVGWVIGTLLVVVFVVWVMTLLPHGGRPWPVVIPGAVFFATIVRVLAVFSVVYLAPKLGRVDDLYGGLGMAIVILLLLYLVSRAFVGGEFINATFAGVSHATLRQQADERSGGPAPTDREAGG